VGAGREAGQEVNRAHVWRREIALVILGASVALSACGRQSTKPPEPKEPICEVLPDTLDFGRVEQGSTAERSFRVTNIGTAGLQTAIHLACDRFRIVEGGGETTIAPGETLSVRVEYAPESREEARCSVELDSIACGAVELVGNGFRTWHIHVDGSGDAPTVQAGIDSSHDGDVVLVGPGTYYENINLRGRAIHLVSEAGPEETILDGSRGDNAVVQCVSHESNGTVIEGFTITGGSGWAYNQDTRVGGGIFTLYAAPVIRGNTIEENEALNGPTGGNSRGGGVSFGPSLPELPPTVIEQNTIEDNYCSRNSGGINITGPCIIQDNVIRGNVTGTGDGGGLYLLGTVGRVIIRRNLIIENHAADHGGGLYLANVFGGSPELLEVSSNVIIGNEALGAHGKNYCPGGGVWIAGGAKFHHNTVAFNVAETTADGLSGGGCCLLQTLSGTSLEYNIFFGNSEGGVVTDDRSIATLFRNLLFDNDVADIEVLEGADITEDGSLFVDPLFCDTTSSSLGELEEDSPALDQPYGVIGAVATPGCPGRDGRSLGCALSSHR
jgi:hypothetical protein